MKTRFKKISAIADELLSYCHRHGANEFHIDITGENDFVTLVISARTGNISNEELESLKNRLNAPRRRDVEQDFWELIGESESSSELTLTGMLCDAACVNYDGKVLTISLTRYD